MASEIPPEALRVPAPHQAPQPRVTVPGRKISLTSNCKDQWEFRLVSRGLLETLFTPLKGPVCGLIELSLRAAVLGPHLKRHQRHAARN